LAVNARWTLVAEQRHEDIGDEIRKQFSLTEAVGLTATQ
jgi:hypothetical protein